MIYEYVEFRFTIYIYIYIFFKMMFQVHCFLFLSFLHPRWLAKIFVINTIYCLVNDFGVSKSRYDWSTC